MDAGCRCDPYLFRECTGPFDSVYHSATNPLRKAVSLLPKGVMELSSFKSGQVERERHHRQATEMWWLIITGLRLLSVQHRQSHILRQSFGIRLSTLDVRTASCLPAHVRRTLPLAIQQLPRSAR